MKMRRALILLLLPAMLLAADKTAKTPESDAPPTITITVGQLWTIAAAGSLEKLAAADLPIPAAFRLHSIIDALAPHIQRAMKAKVSAFTDENSTADANGNRYPKPGKLEDIEKALEPLAAEKVSITVTPIVVEDDLPGVKLTANDIAALGPLIKLKGK